MANKITFNTFKRVQEALRSRLGYEPSDNALIVALANSGKGIVDSKELARLKAGPKKGGNGKRKSDEDKAWDEEFEKHWKSVVKKAGKKEDVAPELISNFQRPTEGLKVRPAYDDNPLDEGENNNPAFVRIPGARPISTYALLNGESDMFGPGVFVRQAIPKEKGSDELMMTGKNLGFIPYKFGDGNNPYGIIDPYSEEGIRRLMLALDGTRPTELATGFPKMSEAQSLAWEALGKVKNRAWLDALSRVKNPETIVKALKMFNYGVDPKTMMIKRLREIEGEPKDMSDIVALTKDADKMTTEKANRFNEFMGVKKRDNRIKYKTVKAVDKEGNVVEEPASAEHTYGISGSHGKTGVVTVNDKTGEIKKQIGSDRFTLKTNKDGTQEQFKNFKLFNKDTGEYEEFNFNDKQATAWKNFLDNLRTEKATVKQGKDYEDSYNKLYDQRLQDPTAAYSSTYDAGQDTRSEKGIDNRYGNKVNTEYAKKKHQNALDKISKAVNGETVTTTKTIDPERDDFNRRKLEGARQIAKMPTEQSKKYDSSVALKQVAKSQADTHLNKMRKYEDRADKLEAAGYTAAANLCRNKAAEQKELYEKSLQASSDRAQNTRWATTDSKSLKETRDVHGIDFPVDLTRDELDSYQKIEDSNARKAREEARAKQEAEESARAIAENKKAKAMREEAERKLKEDAKNTRVGRFASLVSGLPGEVK